MVFSVKAKPTSATASNATTISGDASNNKRERNQDDLSPRMPICEPDLVGFKQYDYGRGEALRCLS